MRILILTNKYTGLYSFRKEVIKALKDEGHEVIVSAPVDEMTGEVEKLGCKIIDTQFNRKGVNPIKDIALMIRYTKLLKRVKPDVVLSYTIKPNLYGGMACQLCHVPQIANVTGLGSAVENPGWLQKLTISLYKVGLRKSYMVFFQNKANKAFCEKHGMVKGNTKLIPGSGVNLQYHTLQEYPAPSEPVRFIIIGRLLREKGIDEYFVAAENLKKKYPDVEFHVLGWIEGNYENKIKTLQENGVVIFHGPQPDVRPYIVKSHCIVHPSFYPEGMSNVLLESSASGRPIITTDRPGCGEIVDDGVNGFVVKQQDSADLTEKIERFLSLPYEVKRSMGISAREKVEREFDRNIVVKAYMDCINSIKINTKV